MWGANGAPDAPPAPCAFREAFALPAARTPLIAPRRLYSIPLPQRPPLELGSRTLVMGILNVTPDSFADGGIHFDVERAVAAATADGGRGADLIDVGGESTRPGAEPLPADEEMRRVLPVIERLALGHLDSAVDRHLQGGGGA